MLVLFRGSARARRLSLAKGEGLTPDMDVDQFKRVAEALALEVHYWGRRNPHLKPTEANYEKQFLGWAKQVHGPQVTPDIVAEDGMTAMCLAVGDYLLATQVEQ